MEKFTPKESIRPFGQIRLHAPNKCLVKATCRSSSADEATSRSDGATCRRDVSQRFVA